MEENYNQPLTQEPAPKHKLNKANIVMAILLVLAIAAATTFGVLWATKNTDDTPIANGSTIVEDCQIDTETKDCGCPTNNEEKVLGFETSDIAGLNDGNTSYNINVPVRGDALSLSFSTDGRVHITFNWESVNYIYSIAHQIEGDSQSEAIEFQFSQKVVDMFLASFGQAPIDDTILFLMEDGSVEYMPVVKAIKNNEIKSFGKLEGLENIAKFYSGTRNYADGRIGPIESFAQSSDGKIYQLYTILDEAGAWDR